MRQLAAILGDSFRQAIDRKVLIVLLALAAVPILFCFAISFESEPLPARIADLARGLNQFRYKGGLLSMSVNRGVEFTVGEVRPVGDGDGWPADVRGGNAFDVAFTRPEGIDDLARAWQRFKVQKRERRPPPEEAAPGPVAPADRIAFLEERFRSFGFSRARAEADPANPARFRIAVTADYPQEVPGAHTISVLFGTFKIPLQDTSVAEFVLGLQLGLADLFAGFIVMLIAVSSTAGFVPDMLRKGTLDLVLARPIGRARLLLYKYLGGLWFVGIIGSFLIGGCWLGLAVRTGVTSPWFLFSIVTLLAIFAVLYAVSVLAGVLTRSAGLSTLVALGVWGASSIVVGVRHSLGDLFAGAEIPQMVKTSLEVAYTVLPKTKDLGLLNTFLLSRAQLSTDAFGREIGGILPDVDWARSLGTTALFTAAMLALAVWIFRRKDF